jgi:hypothetical protein
MWIEVNMTENLPSDEGTVTVTGKVCFDSDSVSFLRDEKPGKTWICFKGEDTGFTADLDYETLKEMICNEVRSRLEKKEVHPTEEGYYWATCPYDSSRYTIKRIIVNKCGSSIYILGENKIFNISDFKNYSKKIVEQ